MEALRDGTVLSRRIVRPLGVLLLVASVGVAMATSVGIAGERPTAIARERPTAIARVAGVLHERGLDDGLVLVQGMSSGVYVPYIGDRFTTDPSSEGIVAIAIEQSARFPVDPRVEAYLASADPTVLQLDDLQLVLTGGPLPVS